MKNHVLLLILLVNVSFVANADDGVDALQPSYTLPCIYIETENHDSILSKTEYINAKMYIDVYGENEYEGVGSVEDPIDIQIRGRGNWTWRSFDKKPYKIKLRGGQKLLGMKSNKHWALLSHPDDPTGFYRNTLGFEVSRMIGMPYTPSQRPIELVLNGEYLGLYFLTETIKVGKNRLDIEGENELETDELKVGQGGWLVEFDNYEDDHQIKIDVSDTFLKKFFITYHTPEELSESQNVFLISQFHTIKEAIFTHDEDTFWNMVDIESLAKYTIIAEVLTHQEAFVGSCFLWKNVGDSKWQFGPVWDFGSSIWEYYRGHTWEDNYFGNTILTELIQMPQLIDKIRQIWPDFYLVAYPHIDNYIDIFANEINAAIALDVQRWPNLFSSTYTKGDILERAEFTKKSMKTRIEWLNKQWGQPTNICNTLSDSYGFKIYNSHGMLIYNFSKTEDIKERIEKLPCGLYILNTPYEKKKIIKH